MQGPASQRADSSGATSSGHGDLLAEHRAWTSAGAWSGGRLGPAGWAASASLRWPLLEAHRRRFGHAASGCQRRSSRRGRALPRRTTRRSS